MVGWDEVRELALSFPDTSEHVSWGAAHWRVHGRGFVWERPLRKADLAFLGIVEQEGPVLGVRVEDEAVKSALVEEDPMVFFTTPHFDGFPAVLVRLDRVSRRRLEELAAEAFLAVAPKRLADEWYSHHGD
ncbi:MULTISPECIES: MmcQ/YjbR family DNA-binding protein [unclassified Agromyces]|uniref:MmcQ/YjbR family DNA-binding protein n=1 Tax=unclassified Agromyces TaxID=2639701 RepID=UPI003014C340